MVELQEIDSLESVSNYTPDTSYATLFFIIENNKVVLKAKKSDSTIVTVLG